MSLPRARRQAASKQTGQRPPVLSRGAQSPHKPAFTHRRLTETKRKEAAARWRTPKSSRAALKAEGITECGFLPRAHFRVLNERLMQLLRRAAKRRRVPHPLPLRRLPQGRAEHLAVRARKGLPRLFRRALRTAACGASEHLSRRTLCRLLRPLAHRRKGRRPHGAGWAFSAAIRC